MKKQKKPYGYWKIKENCQKEALKYKTRNEFEKGSRGAQYTSYKNNWLDEFFPPEKSKVKPKGYWTKELCREKSLLCKSRSEFQKKHNGAYLISSRRNWIDEICSHMVIDKFKYKHKKVYLIIFKNLNKIYVGISYDVEKRAKVHLKNKSYKYRSSNKHIRDLIDNGNIPKYEIKPDWISSDKCKRVENNYIKHYKDNGWEVLNITKGGSLGGTTIKWTKENCRKEALKYTTRSEFQKENSSAYSSVRKNKWVDEICSHMVPLQKKSGHWNIKENCRKEALKYKKRIEFWKGSIGAISSARRNGWVDEICSHMELSSKPNGYWNIKENCLSEALKYTTRSEFKGGCGRGYEISRKESWLDEVCDHMKLPCKPNGYWNIKENCRKEALKYTTRSEFQKENSSAYGSSREKNWLNELCNHMILQKKKSGYWSIKENCRVESLKYKKRTEFKEGCARAYEVSRKKGWLDEFY